MSSSDHNELKINDQDSLNEEDIERQTPINQKRLTQRASRRKVMPIS